MIYKTEGSSNNDSDKDDEVREQEESFEIEEEIEHIKRLMKLSNDAMILDEILPDSQKEKNSHLNELRKDPHVDEFFEGETPNVSDLPELNKALVEAMKDKKKELSEAKKYANDESSTNDELSTNDESSTNSSLRESNNTFNNKEDYRDYSDYKLGNSLLDFIIEILKDLFS